MKITLDGDVNLYYVQTLCLMFFPGSKFSEKEERAEGEPMVSAQAKEFDGGCFAAVKIEIDGDEYMGESTVLKSEIKGGDSLAAKIAVGRAFLAAAEKLFGFVPPWGILTGVRPAKLAMKNLDLGMSHDECVDAFVNDYSVTAERARLASQVASVERKFITPESRRRCSVYIAIPFCPTRCSYCSFVSFTSKKLLSLIPEYIDVLRGEIAETARIIKELGLEVSSVYIGGGTPTVLSEEKLSLLLDTVNENFDIEVLEEFTLEAGRPDTINAEKLRIAKDGGVTRISVNTQTLNDNILEAIGRRHTGEDFLKAYSLALESGIKDINVDLIAGLPGESFESFRSSIDRVVGLHPTNVTVHTFCVKRAADVLREDRNVYFSKHETALRSVNYSQKVLADNGYAPYYMYRQKNTMGNLENVGYSMPGHEGLYNIYMMEEIHSVFGVGASAMTKLVSPSDGGAKIVRISENKYPYEYLREKSSPESGEAHEKKRQQIFDFYKEN